MGSPPRRSWPSRSARTPEGVPLLAEMLPELECVGRVVEAAIAARKVIQKPCELHAAADGHVAAVKALAFSEHVFDEDKGPKPVARIAVVDLEDPVPRPLAVLETSWTRVIRQRPTDAGIEELHLLRVRLRSVSTPSSSPANRSACSSSTPGRRSSRREARRCGRRVELPLQLVKPRRSVLFSASLKETPCSRASGPGWRRDRDQASRSSGSQAS
jgi:hypothetical protein